MAKYYRQPDVLSWLEESTNWEPLDYLARGIDPWRGADRTFRLLRAAADVNRSAPGATLTYEGSPHTIYLKLQEQGLAGPCTAAHMILEAAAPWRPQTHKYFPPPARSRAVELMLIGELLSREERFAAYGPQAVVDAWMDLVVPDAVSRNHVDDGQEDWLVEMVNFLAM